MSRFYGFLRTRIPLHRTYLLPSQHWVWDSLRSKMDKILSIVIASGHLVKEYEVQYRTCDESLLPTIDKFTTVCEGFVEDDHDSNYLVYGGKDPYLYVVVWLKWV